MQRMHACVRACMGALQACSAGSTRRITQHSESNSRRTTCAFWTTQIRQTLFPAQSLGVRDCSDCMYQHPARPRRRVLLASCRCQRSAASWPRRATGNHHQAAKPIHASTFSLSYVCSCASQDLSDFHEATNERPAGKLLSCHQLIARNCTTCSRTHRHKNEFASRRRATYQPAAKSEPSPVQFQPTAELSQYCGPPAR